MKKAMLGIMMIGDALFLDKPIYNYLRYIPCMHTMYTCVYIYIYIQLENKMLVADVLKIRCTPKNRED